MFVSKAFQDAIDEGISLGRIQGLKEGRAQGISLGIKEERNDVIRDLLKYQFNILGNSKEKAFEEIMKINPEKLNQSLLEEVYLTLDI